MFLMIDNYDSFTYNLYALFKKCGASMKIIKNDEYIPADDFKGIVLSPGPSNPGNAGTTLQYLKEYTGLKPIFGVCLGMQSIAYTLGYDIVKAKTIKHGKIDRISTSPSSLLFHGVPKSFNVVRYHSLAVDMDDDHVTSRSEDDSVVMSIEYPDKQLYGLQFHPESILSEYGDRIVKNFLALVT